MVRGKPLHLYVEGLSVSAGLNSLFFFSYKDSASFGYSNSRVTFSLRIDTFLDVHRRTAPGKQTFVLGAFVLVLAQSSEKDVRLLQLVSLWSWGVSPSRGGCIRQPGSSLNPYSWHFLKAPSRRLAQLLAPFPSLEGGGGAESSNLIMDRSL